MQVGVWNARVLLREVRERGHAGSSTLLTDWMHPQRDSARVVAVRRFETPPAGKGKWTGAIWERWRWRTKSGIGGALR